MSPRFLDITTGDGSRWIFNLDQLVKVRVSPGERPKVSVEMATGRSYALDREASADFLTKFQAVLDPSS